MLNYDPLNKQILKSTGIFMEKTGKKLKFDCKQLIIWSAALIIGCALGMLKNPALNGFFDFIANIYSNLFKFVAVPTIALAITTTLAQIGSSKNTGRRFLVCRYLEMVLYQTFFFLITKNTAAPMARTPTTMPMIRPALPLGASAASFLSEAAGASVGACVSLFSVSSTGVVV